MQQLIYDVWSTVDDKGESLRGSGYATAEAAKLRPEFLMSCFEALIANFNLSVVEVTNHLDSTIEQPTSSINSQNSYQLFWTDCDRGVDVDCSRTFDSVTAAREGIGDFLEELLAMAQDEATCAVVLRGAVRCEREREGSIEFVEGDLGSILDGRD